MTANSNALYADVALTARLRRFSQVDAVEAPCYDLSPGGMFIEAAEPDPTGTLLWVECESSDGTGSIWGVVKVLWRRDHEAHGLPRGMGVKFVNLKSGSAAVIKSVLQRAGPEPPTGYREAVLERASVPNRGTGPTDSGLRLGEARGSRSAEESGEVPIEGAGEDQLQLRTGDTSPGGITPVRSAEDSGTVLTEGAAEKARQPRTGDTSPGGIAPARSADESGEVPTEGAGAEEQRPTVGEASPGEITAIRSPDESGARPAARASHEAQQPAVLETDVQQTAFRAMLAEAEDLSDLDVPWRGQTRWGLWIAALGAVGLVIAAVGFGLGTLGDPQPDVQLEPEPAVAHQPPPAEKPTSKPTIGSSAPAPEPSLQSPTVPPEKPAVAAAPALSPATAQRAMDAPTASAATSDRRASAATSGRTRASPRKMRPSDSAQTEQPSAKRARQPRRQTRLQKAKACLARGDNQCVIRILEGRTRSAQELGLLIETYNWLGDTKRAEKKMKLYLRRYPSTAGAHRYQQLLEEGL